MNRDIGRELKVVLQSRLDQAALNYASCEQDLDACDTCRDLYGAWGRAIDALTAAVQALKGGRVLQMTREALAASEANIGAKRALRDHLAGHAVLGNPEGNAKSELQSNRSTPLRS